MTNRIINTLNEFYVYADANVFDSTSAINLKIDIDNLIENDKRKIQYCKDHNIELRVIKYDQEYDIYDLI